MLALVTVIAMCASNSVGTIDNSHDGHYSFVFLGSIANKCCTCDSNNLLFVDDEFDGFPQTKRTISENEKKTYFQIGPREGVEQPADGWKVMLILPGGDGSEGFNAFCRRIHKNALPSDYVAVQLVAPVWTDDDNRVVWPTKNLNPQKAEFTTETLIREAIADLKNHVKINDRHVFALGWSSGGPPLYVNSVTEDSPVTGSFCCNECL